MVEWEFNKNYVNLEYNNLRNFLFRRDKMNKERLAAFTDAVLAIIMTILVLELKKPKVVSWVGLWDIRTSFFAYAVSFFWLGLMWSDNHRAFQKIKKVSNATVTWTLIMLFFASFFPYSTSLVAANFNNSTAQVFYGIDIILVSLSNIGISYSLNKVNKYKFKMLFNMSAELVIADLAIKVIGLILALVVFPPAVMYSIFVASAMLVIVNLIESKKKRQEA